MAEQAEKTGLAGAETDNPNGAAAPEGTSEAPPADPDYKALFEAGKTDLEVARAETTKLNQDLASANGRRRSEGTLEDTLLGIGTWQTNLDEKMDLIAEAIAPGDSDLKDGLAKVTQEGQNSRAQTSRNLQARGAAERVKVAVAAAGLDLDTAPELASFRSDWKALGDVKSWDINVVRDLADETVDLLHSLTLKSEQAKTTAAEGAAAGKIKTALDKAGINDTDTGPPGGGGAEAITETNIDNLMARVGEFSPARQKEIRKAYAPLMEGRKFGA